jgi:membrane-associated HD superfamily phosphohydrolase
VLEGAYRYPGPRPQSREAAILMICDAAESASRTLSDPTPARLESLVSQLIDKRLADNQFDDCGMTLKELAEIRKSITKSLIAIYHARIKYPEPRSA